MKRTVFLGDLHKNRVFTFSGRRYQVAKNLGPAGVSVVEQKSKRVKIGGREFDVRETREQVWSAGAEVEIDVRPKPLRRGQHEHGNG